MDGIENVILLEITSNLENAAGLSSLAYPVWAKLFAIMACIAATGIFITLESTKFWRVAGVITAFSSSTILIAFLAPQSFGWLIRHGVTIGWLTMFGYAIKMLVQQKASRQ